MANGRISSNQYAKYTYNINSQRVTLVKIHFTVLLQSNLLKHPINNYKTTQNTTAPRRAITTSFPYHKKNRMHRVKQQK